MEDVNKDNESKEMPDNLKNKTCDCWAEKAVVKYKSVAEADKDSSSAAFKELAVGCLWNKEFLGWMFKSQFKNAKEFKDLGDDNISKISDCAAEKSVTKFKSVSEIENGKEGFEKIGEDCANEVMWNKDNIKNMFLNQFKNEEKMKSFGADTLNKIASCLSDNIFAKYKSFSEASKVMNDESAEMSKILGVLLISPMVIVPGYLNF
jgi:hypothetical protein